MGTAFTYQGQLKQSGVPVNATCDFAFTLWDGDDDPDPGTRIGSAIPLTTEVGNGLFQVELDFGSTVFNGNARWLEIDVCCSSPCSPGFTTLSPRQAITPVPYALALPGLRTEPSTDAEFPDGPIIIGGFSGNSTTIGVVGATIAGGGIPDFPNRALGDFSTVSGGAGNTASEPTSTVGGGGLNTASGDGSTVGGGDSNTADGSLATVGGGADNIASGNGGTVGGGDSNVASGDKSAVGGGEHNTASGDVASVPGGSYNEASGNSSLAAGQRAQASHPGSFVWSDSTTADPDFFTSTGDNQFLISAAGGVGINTNSPGASLHIGGAAGIDGLMFPDGTLQTTAATGGGEDNHWSASGSNIYYDSGKVGIGTSSPSYPLHVETSDQYAVFGLNTSNSFGVSGVFGSVNAATGTTYGVFGESVSVSGRAVVGHASAQTGDTYGGWFNTKSSSGIGVFGDAEATSGTTYGVFGRTLSPDGYAGYFEGGRNYFEGNVGIQTATPEQALDVVGNIQTSQGILVKDSEQPIINMEGGSDPISNTRMWINRPTSSGKDFGIQFRHRMTEGTFGGFYPGDAIEFVRPFIDDEPTFSFDLINNEFQIFDSDPESGAITLGADRFDGSYIEIRNRHGQVSFRAAGDIDSFNTKAATVHVGYKGPQAHPLELYGLSGSGAANGGWLKLREPGGGDLRALLDGTGSSGKLELNYFATNTISIMGYRDGAGVIDIKNAAGNIGVQIDGAGANGGGEIELFNDVGGTRTRTVQILGHENNASVMYLYYADGTTKAIELDTVQQSGEAGFLMRNLAAQATVVTLADEANDGAVLFLRKADGTTTIELDASETGADGAEFLLRDAASHITIEMDAEEGGGGGVILLRNNTGALTLEIDASESGRPALRLFDTAGTAQVQLYVNSSGQGIVQADVKNFREPNPRDPQTDIWYASIEGPEVAAYVRGTARLINGRASVSLPAHFQDVVVMDGMTVHVTPWSASSKGLAVVERSIESFVVVELLDGKGSYGFDWEVKAVRRGHEDYRVIRPVYAVSLEE